MNQIATIHLCNRYVPTQMQKIIPMQSKYSEKTTLHRIKYSL